MTRWEANGLDITERVATATWSGSVSRCARELKLTVAVSDTDVNLPPLELPLFAPVRGSGAEGEPLFLGQIVKRKRTTGAAAMELTALDRGFQFSNNQGWYAFRDVTPEAAVAVLCADFGIPKGEVAATGVTLSRKFPGVALHQIVDTLYTMAGERTGKKYLVGFRGEALTVREKPEEAGAVLAPRVDLQTATFTEDASKCCNSVAIYSETGALVRTVDNAGDRALAGLLQSAVVQRKGKDASDAAKAKLEAGEVRQDVTVECLGALGLTTGQAVEVRDNASGARGLFWIDADTHTWKNGRYFCRLTLNFRNLMNDTGAGGEL